eukprot:766862-Hanusia_phi.AAC.2
MVKHGSPQLNTTAPKALSAEQDFSQSSTGNKKAVVDVRGIIDAKRSTPPMVCSEHDHNLHSHGHTRSTHPTIRSGRGKQSNIWRTSSSKKYVGRSLNPCFGDMLAEKEREEFTSMKMASTKKLAEVHRQRLTSCRSQLETKKFLIQNQVLDRAAVFPLHDLNVQEEMDRLENDLQEMARQKEEQWNKELEDWRRTIHMAASRLPVGVAKGSQSSKIEIDSHKSSAPPSDLFLQDPQPPQRNVRDTESQPPSGEA